MRPGQKNRMRGGRGPNPSRRGPNPLTRSYESNGPDVKVRGTPQHIAEKYVQLARDAHSSSDTVMAESYLQHAEHYYRIIAAAQNVQQAAYNQANGLPNTSPAEDEDEDEFEVAGADRFTFRAPQTFQQPNGAGGFNGQPGYQPGQQPYSDIPGVGDQPQVGADGQPVDGGQQAFQPRPPRQDRPFDNRRPFEDRGDRGPAGPGRDRQGRRFGRDRNFPDRPPGERQPDRQPGDRGNGETRAGDERPVEERQPEARQPEARASEARAPEERSAKPAAANHDEPGLPSFITAPVRPVAEAADVPSDEEAGRFRTRRRRRPRAEGAPEAAGGDEPA